MEQLLNEELSAYLKASKEETLRLIEAIAVIPAPSGQEERRAEFCRRWLEEQGAEEVYVDGALNVVCPIGVEDAKDLILFSAHTDVVFPDTDPLPFFRDGADLCAPGVGDDTACLAVLLMIAKYVIQNKLRSPYGILFVANSCEEGLGNLKGIREIMKRYGDRIRRAYTFDGQYTAVVNRCVGSHRYRVTLETEGGHSYGDFGNRNAIFAAAELLTRLSRCEIPQNGQGRTTFNVGTIEGGTSVNTIAQSASFLYEFRSDDRGDLDRMESFFREQIETAERDALARITVECVGIRPCGGEVDESVLEKMTREAVEISRRHSGLECCQASGSTDCNIPMSMGIPAICVGSYLGEGQHTREERVHADSIAVGLKIAAEIILGYFIGKDKE